MFETGGSLQYVVHHLHLIRLVLCISDMGFRSIVLFSALCLFHASLALPLCTDSRAPTVYNSSLSFCPYNGSVCCDAQEDMGLRRQLGAMSISDPSCASVVKSILCAKCDPLSAELFEIESQTRSLPILCNSTSGYCTKVWDACQNVSIQGSLFTPLRGSAITQVNSSTSKLSDLWSSKNDFCETFGGTTKNDSLCFDGTPITLTNSTEPRLSPTDGFCLERLGNGSFLDMVGHPDGSSRVFLATQDGRIYLATVPEVDSGGLLELNESDPFLDLTDEVHFDSEFGLLSIAFHPNFVRNGRFFASFNCDRTSSISCSGRCSCNSEAGCDPSKLSADNGAQPCRYHSVIAEFTANSSSSTLSQSTSANPTEVRRIFTMGLPFTGHHAGQILFGPQDGYMYFMMGDGGQTGDPYNFAQNKKSLLGKIMRFDVNTLPSAREISDRNLWGNYTIPTDNPYREDADLEPEIWALGFRNPWRCSFDSENPSYFFCADVGQEVFEEVDLVTKSGNYGWRVYEGPSLFTPTQTPGGNTSASSIVPIFPVMGYYHSEVNAKEGSASITGGFVYRGTSDPCMHGRFIYSDLYAGAIWAGTENPENSGNFTSSKINFRCARNSPVPCNSIPGSATPSLDFIFSFGQDNNNDLYVLASSGVYRVVRPSRCNFTCSREVASNEGIPSPPTSPSPSFAYRVEGFKRKWIVLVSFLFFLLGL